MSSREGLYGWCRRGKDVGIREVKGKKGSCRGEAPFKLLCVLLGSIFYEVLYNSTTLYVRIKKVIFNGD